MASFLRARRTQLPAQPLTAAAVLQYLGGGGRSASGVDVTPETAMRHMAVLRAITLTAGTIAGLPLKTYRNVIDPATGAVGRVETNNGLFLDPMHAELDITWFEGIEFIVSQAMRFGNSISLIIRNEAGTAISRLLPLPWEVLQRIWRQRGPDGVVRKYIRIVGIDEDLTADEVLHVPDLSLNGIMGLSPIDAAREAIGIGLAGEQVSAHLFDSGLLAGGFLKALGPTTDAQAAQAKQRWRERVGGLMRAYEVAMLSEGWEFQSMQIPPKDAQFLDGRKFSVQEIGRLYGVPPALLWEYSDTGNVDAEKLGAQWLRFSLGQRLARLEDRFSYHLLPRGQFCAFGTDDLWRGTTLEEAQADSALVAAGINTVDEIRARRNYPPLPEPEQPEDAPPNPPVPEPVPAAETEEAVPSEP